MKWAKDFRMDSPFSQRGENTNNSWYDFGKWLYGTGIKVTADNFAIPAATIRGLFDYDYRWDRLILRPRVPGCITQYTQKQPVRFGTKNLYVSCRNGGPKVKSVTVNGRKLKVTSPGAVIPVDDQLPAEARIEITTQGGWPKEASTVAYPALPALVPEQNTTTPAPAQLTDALKRPFAVLSAMSKLLASEPGAEYERAFVSAAISACEDYRARATLDPGPGYYRPINKERKAALNGFYEQTALGLYNGFAKRMAVYAQKGDALQKHLAALFSEAQKP